MRLIEHLALKTRERWWFISYEAGWLVCLGLWLFFFFDTRDCIVGLDWLGNSAVGLLWSFLGSALLVLAGTDTKGDKGKNIHPSGRRMTTQVELTKIDEGGGCGLQSLKIRKTEHSMLLTYFYVGYALDYIYITIYTTQSPPFSGILSSSIGV